MTPTVVNLQSRSIALVSGGGAWDHDHNRTGGAARAGLRIEQRRRVAHKARTLSLGRLIGVGEQWPTGEPSEPQADFSLISQQRTLTPATTNS
jgi:hypothetical protein